MMNYIPVIGLELHVEMKTKSKMFSSAPVSFGQVPNSNVSNFDMAFPGTLPSVNKQAVINTIRVCHALHMDIDSELHFDRKNYFYSDLPKGYQITQFFRPIGTNGYIEIGDKKINIIELHIEEDACKQIHLKDRTLLDFNRAGIPLIEIVSAPEIRNGVEAMQFVQEIRSIVTFLDVSNGKMEEGSLRCDINISLKKKDDDSLGTRVEIKNINTLSNIKKAIDYEIERQIELLENGKEIKKETRRFDEQKKKTVAMRLKIDSVDYKYFEDANIIPIILSDEFIKSIITSSPKLAKEKYLNYLTLGLNDYDASLIISNKEKSDYFDSLIKYGVNYKLAANWLNGEVQSYLNKNKIEMKDFPIDAHELADLLILIEKKTFSHKQGREIFGNMIMNGDSLQTIISHLNMGSNYSEERLKGIINDYLTANVKLVIDYKNGKDRVIGYIVGHIMKMTNGEVNPALCNKLVHEELKRR